MNSLIVPKMMIDRQNQTLAWRSQSINLSPSDPQLFFVGGAIARIRPWLGDLDGPVSGIKTGFIQDNDCQCAV